MQALLPDLDLEELPPEEEPRPAASSSRRNFALWIQIAGLVAGSWVFFVTTMSGAPQEFTWAGLLGHGLRYAFFTWAWSAAITFLLYLTVPAAERRDVAWNTLRVSAAAVWFAPAILLLADWSPSTLAAGLVLTASATRMLYSQWRVMHPRPADPVAPPIESLFTGHGLPRRAFGRELAPVLASAGLLQLGTVELGMEKHLLSGALLVAGSAMLAIQAISRGAWSEQRPASLPRSFMGALFTILLAASLTVTGLRGHVVPGGLLGSKGGANSQVTLRELLRQLMGKDQPTGAAAQADRDAKKKGAGNRETTLPAPTPLSQAAGGTFPGIILRPEVQPVVTLIAPLPAVKNGFPSATSHPFSIPFAGEYWMWRWGVFNRPPPNSYQQTGTPSELSFRTVDEWPLQMEARQKLIQPIDLSCCQAVQIEIRNADPVAAAVQLEMVVIGDGGAELSLGLARVLSRPDTSKDPIVPVAETLGFPVPAHVSIGMMQEFKVVFRRMRVQAHRSAKISIARFLLVPR